MKYARYCSDRYMEVHERAMGYVKLVPIGGGFISEWIKEECIDEFVDEIPREYLNGTAYIESYEDEVWTCTCDPYNKWNGWDQPLFTRDIMEKICEASSVIREFEKDGDIYCRYEGQADEEIEPLIYECNVNGEKLYGFAGWCWEFEPRK